MNLKEKIIYKGLDYNVSGKKEFIRKILSLPETRDAFISWIIDSGKMDELDKYNKVSSFDNQFHSVSLDEKTIINLFDLATANKIEGFLSNNNLSNVDRHFYIAYLAPLLSSESSHSLKIDYCLIYGIVNQEKCHKKLKDLWLSHPEYYSFFLTKMKVNPTFESTLQANLIPYSRMLHAMIEIMRSENSENIYHTFIDLFNEGFPQIKKVLKKSKHIDSDTLRDIVTKDLDDDSIPFLNKVCSVAITLALADHNESPIRYDYDILTMLDLLKNYNFEFECEENSIKNHTNSTIKKPSEESKAFLDKFKCEYGTTSSATELYMPSSTFDITFAPQSNMVLQLMLRHGISPRKLTTYKLDDSEINDILGLMTTWNKRNYWYALNISSLCKYINDLEKNIISLFENYSNIERHSYEKEKESLLIEKNRIEKEKLFIQNSIHDLESEIISLNQEISHLRLEKENLSKQHETEIKDLSALRNYVYLMSKKDSDNTYSNSLDIDFNDWLGQKVVVIGGHDSWQSKLKKEFPNWTYLSSANKTFPANAIKDKDYIICNTEALSHAAYYKLVSAKEKNQKLLFVRSNNLDLVMNELSVQLSVS